MLDTQQKTRQLKNVAVALVKDEVGRVLLVKPTEDLETYDFYESTPIKTKNGEWDFPSSTIIPGATYTETFSPHLLEVTGCIVEAVSLVSSEKHMADFIHFEYVECKIVCRDRPAKDNSNYYKWVHPSRLRKYFKRRFNRDLAEFFRV